MAAVWLPWRFGPEGPGLLGGPAIYLALWTGVRITHSQIHAAFPASGIGQRRARAGLATSNNFVWEAAATRFCTGKRRGTPACERRRKAAAPWI